MRYFLAALSGMVLTLCVFVGGAAFAIRYLAAEPIPVQKAAIASETVIPTNPARVNAGEQDFERVERQPAQPSRQDEAIELHTAPMPEIDPIEPSAIDDLTTASIADTEVLEPEPKTTPIEPPAVSTDHVTWCSNRYRSYQPESNSYTSFSGDIRECISPFSDIAASAPDENAVYLEASADGLSFDRLDEGNASAGHLSAEHIESCYSRYRSYRPEDNTYQPYGGGPREQCQ